MNERIQELAYEAEEYADTMVDGGSEFHLTFVKKFAELIVSECSQAVLEVPCYHIDYRAQIEEAVINDCARAVLEHFGVKE